MKLRLVNSDRNDSKIRLFLGGNSTNRPLIVISDQKGIHGAKSGHWQRFCYSNLL
jgi:hypothetical protein